MAENNYQTSKKERISYPVFFFGQNVLWAYAAVISTYLLDIGLDAKLASAILLGPKIWDAVNDTLFGFLIDRTKFKSRQKFLPWIKIGVAFIALTEIFMFAIPKSIGSNTVKIFWFIAAYMLFDCAYTLLDAPMYALPTVLTSNIQERTALISSNRFAGIIGGGVGSVLVPIIRPKTGWLLGAVIFTVFSTLFMLPVLFTAKERCSDENENQEYGFKEMFTYIRSNRYLFISLLLIFIVGVCSIENTLSLVMARNCFGNESVASYVTIISSLPVLVVSLFIPKLTKKYDKYIILIFGMALGFIGGLAGYFAGYSSIVPFIICSSVKGIGMATFMVISYMLVADAVEYGTYKSGIKAAGISFSLQTFTAKMKNAVIASVALFALGLFGYDSSLAENIIQGPKVVSGIWKVYSLMPAVGYLTALIILVVFYKLRDRDVETMARYNNREISKEEAEAVLMEKYGPAGK